MAATVEDGVVVLDVKTGRTIVRVKTENAEMLALDDSGRRLLVANKKSTVWEVDTGRQLLELGMESDKDCLAPAGDVVLGWKDRHEVEIWNVDQRRVQARIQLARETLGPIGYDHTGRRVLLTEVNQPGAALTAWTLNTAAIYDVTTGKKLADLGRSVFSVLDGPRRFLVMSALDGQLMIRDASSGALVSRISDSGTIPAGQVLADGALLAGLQIESLSIRSPKDGRLLAAIHQNVQFNLTQDSFQAGNTNVEIRGDGRSMLQLGPHPVEWTLPREERSPAEVDRIVRERIRWRITNGRLTPVTATLHGRVLRKGVPVAGAEIGLERGTGWLFARTGPDGRFDIPELPYGHYGVVAMAPDRSVKGQHDATIDREDFTADYELDQEATIAGTVVDEAGKPVSGVEVQAGFGEGALRATTDARGEYTITALGPGTFQVLVIMAKDGKSTGFVQVGDKVVATVITNTDHVTGMRLVVKRTTP